MIVNARNTRFDGQLLYKINYLLRKCFYVKIVEEPMILDEIQQYDGAIFDKILSQYPLCQYKVDVNYGAKTIFYSIPISSSICNNDRYMRRLRLNKEKCTKFKNTLPYEIIEKSDVQKNFLCLNDPELEIIIHGERILNPRLWFKTIRGLKKLMS